jgi:hypothetical protein
MKLFENNKVSKLDQTSLHGGQDPGKDTNTYECTWMYRWGNGSNEEIGDTEVDGDWLDDCEK